MTAISKIKVPNITTSNAQVSSDLFDLFKENAEKIGAEVFRVADIAQALAKIEQNLADIEAQRVVAAASPLVKALDIDKLPSVKVEFDRQAALEAQVGICEMELAVAETGSLCQIDPTIAQRWASTLPEVNIVLVSSDRLKGTYNETMRKIYDHWSLLPGYISFVSGPSRTSDIERVLTIGVHGPRRLVILFINDVNGGK